MPRESTPRREAHNQKRAERFAARGITSADLRWARTTYVGRGETNCTLCDHDIEHQFKLDFARPGPNGRVTFEPVGSQCITDWAEALPASPERDAFVADVRSAERARNEAVREARARAQAEERRTATNARRDRDVSVAASIFASACTLEGRQAAADELAALGNVQECARGLALRYLRLPPSVRETGTGLVNAARIRDIGTRALESGFASGAQLRYFVDLIAGAEVEVSRRTAPAPTAVPTRQGARVQAPAVRTISEAAMTVAGRMDAMSVDEVALALTVAQRVNAGNGVQGDRAVLATFVARLLSREGATTPREVESVAPASTFRQPAHEDREFQHFGAPGAGARTGADTPF
jgi:hypothetical protein